MLALFPKVQKTYRPKALKIDVFDCLTVVLRPFPGNFCEYPHILPDSGSQTVVRRRLEVRKTTVGGPRKGSRID